MANFNLVVDTSNFKPFDMTHALQILHDYRDAYYKLEDLMNKIAEEKGLYALPDSPENLEFKSVMDRYNADFDAAANDFYGGMTTENARRIRDIRRRYYSEVTPINKAIEAYNKDLDKITSLGADAIVGNRNRTLKDYYGGLHPSIEYRSGKTIQETAAGIMLGLNNAFAGAPEQVGDIAKQYFILKQQGIKGNDALGEILKHNPHLNSQQGAEDTSQLLGALDKVYQAYAFEEGTPENAEIWQNVVSGAIRGIQAPKYDLLVDHSYESPAARASREQTEEYKRFLKEQRIAMMYNRGLVYDDKTDTFHYDEEVAKQVAADRRAGGASKPAPVLPYFEYNGQKYFFETDSDGDITRMYEANTGKIVPEATMQEILNAHNGAGSLSNGNKSGGSLMSGSGGKSEKIKKDLSSSSKIREKWGG